MSARQRVTNEEIIAAYKDTGSVWKAGKRLGVAGQSVHERLVALNYPINGRKWSDDEVEELLALTGEGITVGEVAMRLGRTFAAVTCKLNELGVKGYGVRRKYKIPKGAGYDKVSIDKHLRSIEASGIQPTRYCRAHGLNIDSLAHAAQKHFMDRWQAIYARSPIPKRNCANCNVEYHPANGKQMYCTRTCGTRALADKRYFGGRRMEAIGMADGICQLCGKEGHHKLTPHHVIGKENDPDNEFMVALCSGCHQLVTLLAARKFADDPIALQSLLTLGWLRRRGADPDLMTKELYVEVIIDVDEPEEP